MAWLLELFDGNRLNQQVQGFASPSTHRVIATKVVIRSI
ncbi:hypothetical protein X737_33330 [Mesorhizobium sp. L48C026A00]|nr:hypothetical protein X737_33330 [Mesorhizobium sp. L48C026A00]